MPTSSMPSSTYFFLEKGSGALCPSPTQSVFQEECLNAAHLIGGSLNLPNWLNVISWANLPCGCFLWHSTDGTILVDYNTETVTCGVNAYTQMICKSASSLSDPVTKPPTSTPTVLLTKTPTEASSIATPQNSKYFFMEQGFGSSCPSYTKLIPQKECLAAAHLIGGDLNLPDWLNVISWPNLPCGCFLWHNTNGAILVDYNTETVKCGANAYTQMICDSSSLPSGPSTEAPSNIPTVPPSKTTAIVSPIASPTTLSPNYFFLEKSIGSSCPSNALSVPQDECLNAAHLIGGDLNLPDWLNVISWPNLPCGCFLWHNTNGAILVDYNTETVTCGANAYTQMICKSA
jgi:hypothetical protein